VYPRWPYFFLTEEFGMATLIANKTFFLNSQMRDIVAGQTFQVPSERKARMFVKIGKARFAPPEEMLRPRLQAQRSSVAQDEPKTEPAAKPEPKEDVAAQEKPEEEAVHPDHDQVISALRERLRALGGDVDGRWGIDRLREEIAAARQQRYNRRDMRPQE
jgi:hypothetical protein